MEMMNRLMSDALDSQKFVDRLKEGELRFPAHMVNPERREGESRTDRRARERAEAKAARKAKA
jgi:hypothetical protein